MPGCVVVAPGIRPYARCQPRQNFGAIIPVFCEHYFGNFGFPDLSAFLALFPISRASGARPKIYIINRRDRRGRKVRRSIGERCPAGARASCGCSRRVGCAAPCVPASSRQAVENAGLGLLWGWAKPGRVAVAHVALARVFVSCAASQRRCSIQMNGLSCRPFPPTTHPSPTPLSLA